MLVFYTHLVWFIGFRVLFLLCLLFSLVVLHSSFSLAISLSLFIFSGFPINLSFYVDYIALSFSSVVLIIRAVIIAYSYNYMAPYHKRTYFIYLTFLFVFSIILVVFMSNLFFTILGWDGLGLVSFFLIVYYQNHSSITSGLFTLLINRIGDCFFLASIALYYCTYSAQGFATSSDVVAPILSFFLLLTFITKRAIYPFSSWLPLAIAAPTPISALVHSSTLVTAGLYLIMRYYYLVSFMHNVSQVMVVVCIFTSFYAGLNSIFEVDLKKLIALSTLRHLGFIGTAFFSGLFRLAFFHILTHALFKSLLFISIGDIITNLSHSQDLRFLSSGTHYTPASCAVMYVSLLNLLGLPSLRGFFSKDLVLETLNYSALSFMCVSLVLFNVAFTYFYTYQLFCYSFQRNKLSPYLSVHSYRAVHSVLLLIMSASSLFFGAIFIDSVLTSTCFYSIPQPQKYFPLILNLTFFIGVFAFGGFGSAPSPTL